MLLVLLVLVLIAAALAVSSAASALARRTVVTRRRAVIRRDRATTDLPDPGRERRAEQRARELLRSCVNPEEWAMYRDLGFIKIAGRLDRARVRSDSPAEGRYAYLVYPHKPIVAFVTGSRRLLAEYCIEFPDLAEAVSGSRLPDSDDVLAKWMALTGDERRLIESANMHLPGRQIDPDGIRRDLWRLEEWERRRRPRGSIEATGA